MLISVVIPAHNEQKSIALCLASLRNQNYGRGDAEVIVIDNGSTDNTANIARELGVIVHSIPKVRVAALRNIGARHAKGDVLFFLDADCVAGDDWFEAGMRSLDAGADVTGWYYRLPPEFGWRGRLFDEAGSYSGPRRPLSILGGNLVTTREAFDRLNGFDETLLVADDLDYSRRAQEAGLRVFGDPSLIVTHYGTPLTFRRYLRQEIWHGMDTIPLLKRVPSDLTSWGLLVFMAAQIAFVAGILMFRVRTVEAAALSFLLVLVLTIWQRKRIRKFDRPAWMLMLRFCLFYPARSISVYRWLFGSYVKSRAK